jgi:hypothetical protein
MWTFWCNISNILRIIEILWQKTMKFCSKTACILCILWQNHFSLVAMYNNIIDTPLATTLSDEAVGNNKNLRKVKHKNLAHFLHLCSLDIMLQLNALAKKLKLKITPSVNAEVFLSDPNKGCKLHCTPPTSRTHIWLWHPHPYMICLWCRYHGGLHFDVISNLLVGLCGVRVYTPNRIPVTHTGCPPFGTIICRSKWCISHLRYFRIQKL